MAASEIARFLAIVPARAEIAIATREGAGANRVGEPSIVTARPRLQQRSCARRCRTIPDTQCGFKMFTARAVESIFPFVTIDGWAFDIEVLVIARRRGLTIEEVPIEWHYRDRSQVSPLRDPLLMAKDVLKIRVNAMRGKYDR